MVMLVLRWLECQPLKQTRSKRLCTHWQAGKDALSLPHANVGPSCGKRLRGLQEASAEAHQRDSVMADMECTGTAVSQRRKDWGRGHRAKDLCGFHRVFQ